MRHLALAVDQLHPKPPESAKLSALQCISCVRAGDLLESCQMLLQNHDPRTRPQCIMGNILDRTSSQFLKKITAARQKHVQRVRVKLANSSTTAKSAVIQTGCEAFLREALLVARCDLVLRMKRHIRKGGTSNLSLGLIFSKHTAWIRLAKIGAISDLFPEILLSAFEAEQPELLPNG